MRAAAHTYNEQELHEEADEAHDDEAQRRLPKDFQVLCM
jgi:hypothetical protein